MEHIVRPGQVKMSNDSRDVLVTSSLGSCVGLTLYDRVAKVGGLIHCMLPLSKIDPHNAGEHPAMFVDTGVTALIQGLFDLGAERTSMVAKVAGAANMCGGKGVFKIGEANQAVLRKILWKNDILISGEDLGGNAPRTMVLEMSSGRTLVRSMRRKIVL